MSNIDGSRLVSYLGNACQSNSYFIAICDTALIQETLDIEFKVQSLDHIYAGSGFTSLSTISYTRDLVTLSKPVMFDTDTLIWELVLPDTIDTFDIELDDDINFISPLIDNISIKNKDEFFYYLEVQDFAQNDLMIDNTRYYWRIKPNYLNGANPTNFTREPQSFIYNPNSVPPANFRISDDGVNIILEWDELSKEKGITYSVYSSVLPFALYPDDWTLEVSGLTDTTWSEPISQAKKFYLITMENGL